LIWRRSQGWLRRIVEVVVTVVASCLKLELWLDEIDPGGSNGQGGALQLGRCPRAFVFGAPRASARVVIHREEEEDKDQRLGGKEEGLLQTSCGERDRGERPRIVEASRWRRGHALPPPSCLLWRSWRRRQGGLGWAEAKWRWAFAWASGKFFLLFFFYCFLLNLLALKINS
jgi:hypothetical protein